MRFFHACPILCNKREASIEKITELRINHDITVSEVRLIDEKGQQAGIVPIEKALQMATTAEMDLVEIAPLAKPVVCKILDYGKFKYRENKKRHEARVRRKQVEVKEIKFHLIISEGDYEVKLRNATRFLNDGDRVKVSVWFRGREISKPKIGMERLQRFAGDLAEVGTVEQAPNMEGKRMNMLIVPKRGKSVTPTKGEKNNAKDEDK